MSSKSAEKTQRVDPTLEKHDPADFANGKAPPPMDGERRGSRWASVSQGRNKGYEEEDPFGDEENGEEGDVKYKTLEWWQAGMIMIAETISLGILSLPSVLAVVGLVPGFLIILGLGVLATYSGYVIGQFKQEYPWVHNMADAFEILFKPLGMPRVGREFGGAAQTIFLIFSMASHILTWTICFSTITSQATCNIVWGVVALIIFWIFDLPRTLKKVSYFSIASFISIFSAVMITMIAVGVERPGVGATAYTLWPAPVPFYTAFLSVTNIVFAYAGHVAFFSFISEFKDPKDFPKALYLLQICDVTMYIVVAIVVYRYAGTGVASPALGSSGVLISKIAYGIAIPTIIIAGVIYGHVASKYIYVRIFRGTKHMAKRTWLATGSWAAITLTLWVIAWIIAESIPDFNDLLALISSLFASWFTYGISGIFWLFMNKGRYFSSPIKIFLTMVNIGLFLLGLSICGIGLYSSGYSIKISDSKNSWACQSSSSS